jgi:glycosyltransferase involved in cell wall biosynthesis
MLEGKNILIVSNEPWGDIWFSKHHYAWELSQNNNVIFLESPPSWDFTNAWKNKVTEIAVSPRLKIARYRNFLPMTGRSKALRDVNNKMVCRLLTEYFKKNNFYPFIFWSFDPVRLEIPRMLNPSFSLFYSVDNHSHRTESDLVRNSDLVLVVTEYLANKYRGFSKPMYLVPHGIPVNKLSEEEIIAHKPSRQVLFIGSINYRMNYRQVIRAAQALPDHTFKFIGLVNKKEFSSSDHLDFNELESMPNVAFTGPKSFHSLQDEIMDSSVCILISKQDYISNLLNSLKILQYLSYGKPVVSCHFETYRNAPQDLIYQYSNDDEFVNLVKEKTTVPEPDTVKRMRIAYTRQFEYPRLISTIGEYINKHLKQ